MKNEGQLYIDDVLVDISNDTKITLELKSNLLKGFNIESNASFTINLPKTVRNRRVLGYADMVQRGVNFPYKYHRARYLRNGVEIVSEGRAVLVEVDDDSFSIMMMWGLFPAFQQMMSQGITLNQLESHERILFGENNEVATYESALAADVFYADIDCERLGEGSGVLPWRWGIEKPGTTNNRIFGGRRGWKEAADRTILLHPCCKVSWVLGLIRQQMGVEFRWSGDELDYINTLIIPIISKKASEDSYDDGFVAIARGVTATGPIPLEVVTAATSILQSQGVVGQSLTVGADGRYYVKVMYRYTFNMSGMRWQNSGPRGGGRMYIQTTSTWYYKLKIVRGSESAEYVIGTTEGGKIIYKDDLENDIYFENAEGYGVMSLERGDVLSMELCSTDGRTGTINNSRLTFEGGQLTIGVMDSDEVPEGGYFPIALNLPEIKIVDFVKFLSIITGTFPVNRFDDGVVRFEKFSKLWENLSEAKDWTRRLIAPHGENSPQNMTFTGDYCQHNRYKWKEDDEVQGLYDGDLTISNETLDVERVVMEFPFAATDGNSVPLYTKPSMADTSSSGSDDEPASSVDDLDTRLKADFDECEPRILRLKESEDGKAEGDFDMDMKSILEEKYDSLKLTLESLKIIKESIRISDVELKNFDETIPVYLAQYGCYFGVLEVKAEDNGLAEVTMVQLIINSGDE